MTRSKPSRCLLQRNSTRTGKGEIESMLSTETQRSLSLLLNSLIPSTYSHCVPTPPGAHDCGPTSRVSLFFLKISRIHNLVQIYEMPFFSQLESCRMKKYWTSRRTGGDSNQGSKTSCQSCRATPVIHRLKIRFWKISKTY